VGYAAGNVTVVYETHLHFARRGLCERLAIHLARRLRSAVRRVTAAGGQTLERFFSDR
jgi:hypothetical protein